MVPNKRVWSLQVFLVQSASCQTSDTLSENMFQKWNSELVGKESFSQIQEKYLRAQEKALCFLSPNKSSGRCVHTSCGPIRNLSICFPRWPGARTQEGTELLTIPFSFRPILPMLFLWGSDTAQVWPNCGDQSTKVSQASGLRWRTCVRKRWPSPKCQLSRITISGKMCVAVMWQTHYQKTQHLMWKA